MDKIYRWQELNLRSGDLLLCAGNSKLSRKIQWFQRLTGAPEVAAKFTHLAGIDGKSGGYASWIGTEFSPSGLFVRESTTMNEWAGKSGVQVNDFEAWLLNYDGRVWVRQLDFPRDVMYYHNENVFWTRHKNDKYENGIPGYAELLLCALRLHRYVLKVFPDYVPKFTTEPHCTELIAKRLLRHCLIYEDAFANRLPPWLWLNWIDDYFIVNIGKTKRIK